MITPQWTVLCGHPCKIHSEGTVVPPLSRVPPPPQLSTNGHRPTVRVKGNLNDKTDIANLGVFQNSHGGETDIPPAPGWGGGELGSWAGRCSGQARGPQRTRLPWSVPAPGSWGVPRARDRLGSWLRIDLGALCLVKGGGAGGPGAL